MMCIVIIAQYADCTPCGFGSRQKVRSVVHPRAAILHFDPGKPPRLFGDLSFHKMSWGNRLVLKQRMLEENEEVTVAFHLVKTIHYFALLVVKEIDHYLFFSGDLSKWRWLGSMPSRLPCIQGYQAALESPRAGEIPCKGCFSVTAILAKIPPMPHGRWSLGAYRKLLGVLCLVCIGFERFVACFC